MADVWTIRQVVAWAAEDFARKEIGSARLDAELLVAHALKISRVGLYLDLERPLSETEREEIRTLITRRRGREPVAYIVGQKEFYGRTFAVNRSVLIPRPETELLVERALAALTASSSGAVLDLCTGSGVVAISLAAEQTELHIDAVDISEDALAVARRNAEQHGVLERVHFFAGNLFSPLPRDTRYGLILANPPYILEDEYPTLAPEITLFEPKVALTGGTDGLDVIRLIIRDASAYLLPQGKLVFEIGHGQGTVVKSLFEEEPRWTDVQVWPDLAGLERVVQARIK